MLCPAFHAGSVGYCEDGRQLQLSAVQEIFSSVFLPKSPELNAEDTRTNGV